MNDMKNTARTKLSDDSNSLSTQLNESSEVLLPAFTTQHYTHLPTPQSPSNLSRYIHDRPYSPETPITNRCSVFHSRGKILHHLTTESICGCFNRRIGARKSVHEEETTAHPSSSVSQCITPESSPHFSHNPPPDHLNPATPRYFVQSSSKSNDYTTPKNNNAKAQTSATLFSNADSSKFFSAPSSPPSELLHQSSSLSSPFMAKLSLGDSHHASQSDIQPNQSDNMSTHSVSISTPPMSPSHPVAPQPVKAGGELDRIRQIMLEDKLHQMREAESRRPEYLKRTKRPLSEVDSSYHDDDDGEGEKATSIGIMESPHKGRRLKLFQETSEESFEESLMAGGYGRYRTADWVRQPQPIALPQTVVAGSGSSNIVSILENAEEAPPTEKQLKKQKRLAAFRSDSQANNKLCPVEVDGKGRVLVDAPAEDRIPPNSPEPVSVKKRAPNKRKRKVNDTATSRKGLSIPGNLDDSIGKPNWPDSEFPWKLRSEERLELEKAEEEERLRWIERFLDRDSDDEEDIDTTPDPTTYGVNPDTTSPHARFSSSYRPGRAEHIARPTIPLSNSHAGGPVRKVGFPSDPADARAALLSKRSVRALSFRQQRRQRELDDEDEEIVCVCHGTDDGRELVQCDACQTWYHLQCIGIRSVAELGREEDPWFCRRCVARSRSPSTEPEDLLSSEPTFVPTDEEPNVRRSDTPFFQPGISDSPNWSVPRMPKTPTRGYAPSDSSRSWLDSSRGGPSTPQQVAQSVKIYSSPYDGYQNYVDESPFDPTSTPSRGIRFHAPFATPKSSGWMPRNNNLFQSPSRNVIRGPTNKTANSSIHYAIPEDSGSRITPGNEYPGRRIQYDESPIRRAEDIPLTHRTLNSPKSRPMHLPYLEESPVMRSSGSQVPRERYRDSVQRRNNLAS